MYSRAFIALPLSFALLSSCSADAAGPADMELAFSVAEHDFGEVMLGMPSDTLRVILVNRSAVRTGQVTVAVSGPQADDFKVVRDLCTGTTLRSGGTCVVVVRLAPTVARASEAVLTAEVAGGPAVSVALRGNGREAGLRLLPGPSMAFGNLATGTSRALRVTVQNLGLSSGTLTTEISGPDAASFAITDDGCAGRTLVYMQTCEIGIRFTPSATGAREASLRIASPGGTATARLLGTSGATTGLVAPAPEDFGLQRTLVFSPVRTVTFTNLGPGSSGFLQTQLSGSVDFSMTQDACSGRSLGVGETCGVSVRFRPTEPGSRSATITVSDGAGSSTTASLVGTGGSVVFSATPAALDFGTRVMGVPASATIEIRNTGTVRSNPVTSRECYESTPWDLASCDGLTGPGSSCEPLDPGASCVLTVRFDPITTGAYTSTIAVGDGASSVSVPLSGAGMGLEPSTRSITFPATATGVPSSSVAVVVTNTANQTTGPVATTVTSGFEVVSQDCGHAILFPGRTCTVVLRAAARDVPGTVSGELRVVASPGGTARTSLSVVVQ